jgi:hypothetical protein
MIYSKLYTYGNVVEQNRKENLSPGIKNAKKNIFFLLRKETQIKNTDHNDSVLTS